MANNIQQSISDFKDAAYELMAIYNESDDRTEEQQALRQKILAQYNLGKYFEDSLNDSPDLAERDAFIENFTDQLDALDALGSTVIYKIVTKTNINEQNFDDYIKSARSNLQPTNEVEENAGRENDGPDTEIGM